VDEIRSHPVQRCPGNEIDRDPGFSGFFQDFAAACVGTRIFLQVKAGDPARLAADKLEDRMKPSDPGGRI
jgi:hypothetical protein